MISLSLSVCRMQSGCDMPVLKGTNERDTGRLFNVWLRGRRLSFGEAGLNPRGVILLPRNNLYSSRASLRGQAGQRINSWGAQLPDCRERMLPGILFAH
jgi:hypothetical protein